MPLAGKIVTVLVLKAVLLSVNPGDRVPTDGYAMAPWGYVCYDEKGIKQYEYPQVTGERVLQDSLAGLTIVVGPSGEGLYLFEGSRGRGVQPDMQEQLLRPVADGSWADAGFDFPIPRTGSAYFIQQVEENLFRRVEFTGRAGISAHLNMTPVAGGLEVELQLDRRLLSGPRFEETLDAWLTRPTLTRVTLGTQLLLPTNKQVLLVMSPGTAEAALDADPVRPDEAGPLGLAMLLELRQWEFLPAVAELRREFEPLAKALGAATGGRARLDLQNTHTPVVPDLPRGVTPPEHGYLTVVPITVQGDEPALIADGEEQYAPIMAIRVAREAEVHLRWNKHNGSLGGSLDRFGPGAYVLCRGDDARRVFLVANEDGSALVHPPRPSGGGSLGGSLGGTTGTGSTRTGLSPGAPTTPFAGFEGWGSTRSGPGAKFRVWFPASDADEERQSIEVTVAEPAVGGSSSSNY